MILTRIIITIILTSSYIQLCTSDKPARGSGSICNTGKRQSPIDLRPHTFFHDPSSLQLINYDFIPERFEVHNDGHTVHLKNFIWANNSPFMTGKSLKNERYIFKAAHLHWSSDDHSGSEHSLVGKRFAAELHLVHYNGKYNSSEEASRHSDGLAVMGVIYATRNYQIPNAGMKLFASLAQTVKQPKESNDEVEPFPLSSFISELDELYTYSGSLTTPPCIENVRWIVLSKTMPISPKIIHMFRNVRLSDGHKNNVRPLQALNNRVIQLYKI
ncbi:carbonic anhydrase 6-like [Trichogramma pretiosum]|uniref:carbonic anhydrase 6-like n=1 Tax=Trichogramma pretiosum TaxID=7493 RepID=UPI0006C9DD05|nr:carbonic anhydrase 6-like [Trichogramma pretiosum]